MKAAEIQKLKEAFRRPLPGAKAQLLMAPSYREEELKRARNAADRARLSAVLILLTEKNGETYIPFIERADYEGVHSGQISFPGGQFDETDHSLLFTALREASEEIGVPAQTPQIVGKLSDLYIPPSNFLVKPFLAYAAETPHYRIDKKEVKRLVEVSLTELLSPEAVKSGNFIASSTGVEKKAPYFAVQNLEIWGATAMIISELLYLIRQQLSRG